MSIMQLEKLFIYIKIMLKTQEKVLDHMGRDTVFAYNDCFVDICRYLFEKNKKP